VCDFAGNCAFYNANRTATVDTTAPRVQIVNFTRTSDTALFLNVSIFDENTINATVVSFASTSGSVNYTNSLTRFPASTTNTSGYYNLSFTGLGYDTYTVYVYVNDSAGNPNSTATSSVAISSAGQLNTGGITPSGGGYSSPTATPTATPAPTVVPTATTTPAGTGVTPTPFATPFPTSTPVPTVAASATPYAGTGSVSSASVAVSTAQDAISSAAQQGKDVSAAQELLLLAQQAQAMGDYASASSYAQQAQSALQAQAATATPVPKPAGASLPAWVLIVGVLVVLVVAYFVFAGRKK